MKRIVLLLAVAGAGCIVPSLTDLEAERARTCDADHPCLTGYLCASGVCQPAGSAECTPGDTRPCGQAGGECRQGTEKCSDAAKWDGTCTGAVGPVTEVCDGKDNDCDGTKDDNVVTSSCGVDAGVCAGKSRACLSGTPEATCSAASFGTDYEASETRCDGLDNDCDGLVDESLPPQPCAKTVGACTGATRTCTQGALPACTAATYLARDAGYEDVESRCDGVDNDCDGLTDSWAPRLVTDGGVPSRRKVAALVQPGTGTAARRDVLALYEEGNRVLSVVLSATGAVSSPRFPSVTITSVAKASSPALGSNGVDVAEAWFEELSCPIFRLPVALAGPAGEAIANGSPGVLPIALPGAGQRVVVGVTNTRIVLAYAHLDSPTLTTSTVVVATCPRTLDSPCSTRSLGAGRNPALLVTGDVALVVYESGSQLSLARLSVPAAGTVTLSGNLLFGGSSEHDPVLNGTLSAVTIYSAVPGSPETLWRRRGDCTTTCDPTGFTSTPTLFTFSGTASSLAVDVPGAAQVLAWEDGTGGQRVARAMSLATTTPLEVSLPGQPGRRPVPLLTGTAGFEVLFDTEGGTGAMADEILSRRFCGP